MRRADWAQEFDDCEGLGRIPIAYLLVGRYRGRDFGISCWLSVIGSETLKQRMGYGAEYLGVAISAG